MKPDQEYCGKCDGSGLVVEAAKEGYTIYRQCDICRGVGYLLVQR